jgi:hypothetical protein
MASTSDNQGRQTTDEARCPNCPCPSVCLGWAAFCIWATEYPSDHTKIRHICTRSAMGAVLNFSRPAPDGGRPNVNESLATIKAMRTCPFRSAGPGCGCAGARCALRRGSIVSYPDCFDCLQRYGSDYEG